jgi:aspartate/tyrosine/aromatic aminotransferase
VARPMYSNPPLHGAQLVATILKDPTLKSMWYKVNDMVHVGGLRWIRCIMGQWYQVRCGDTQWTCILCSPRRGKQLL